MTYDNEDISSMKRVIAVHATGSQLDISRRAAEAAVAADAGAVIVFIPHDKDHKFLEGLSGLHVESLPVDADSPSKQKNCILKWLESRGFKGFLHMIESSVHLNSKSLSYMVKLENVMRILDYNIHFSTATDGCNYVFKKFCPRLELVVDDEDLKRKLELPDKICFTSHSNVSYVTYDFSAFENEVPKFDERFAVGMFFIIEFLARRRATRKDGQLYYMNQYMSISDEIGGYDIARDTAEPRPDEAVMAKENELFKSLEIDYAPDNNIDIVLDAFYNKMKAAAA